MRLFPQLEFSSLKAGVFLIYLVVFSGPATEQGMSEICWLNELTLPSLTELLNSPSLSQQSTLNVPIGILD